MTEHTTMNYSMPRIDRIPYAYRIPVSFFYASRAVIL
jgi:hypothetical protein